jgi:hypothetical protein
MNANDQYSVQSIIAYQLAEDDSVDLSFFFYNQEACSQRRLHHVQPFKVAVVVGVVAIRRTTAAPQAMTTAAT